MLTGKLLVLLCIAVTHSAAGNKPLHAWTGCTTYPDPCQHFGFVPLEATPCDGSSVNATCEVPLVGARSVATPAHVLHALTYNVYELPYWISTSGQPERTCRIPRVIAEKLPQVDVITFQEVFNGGCLPGRVSMRDLLTQAGFPYHTATVGEPLDRPPREFYLINGGIMIASRYPITREKQKVFEYIDTLSPDRVMAKGIMYAEIVKTESGSSKRYHVFNTHLIFAQEDDRREGRREQAREIYEFINAQGIPSDEPVLIGGDFNMDWNQELLIGHIADLCSIMRTAVPVRVGSQQTTHGTFNDWPNVRDKWLDYVLWSTDHQQPESATIQVAPAVKMESKVEICYAAPVLTTWRYLWPDDSTCTDRREIHDLSDHWPVLASYVFPKI